MEWQVSREVRILYSLALFFLPLCLISYRLLLPRLQPTARRLAGAMLAAQIAVILAAFFVQPASTFEARLWDINREFNIPSLAASMQFALVAGVALLTAFCAVGQSRLTRLYLVLVCLVFSLVALDEFFTWKSYTTESGWIQSTIPQGLVMVAATLLAAARSPRASWKWHLIMLLGLAMIALGAIVVDKLPGGSGTFGYMEESLEVAGAWLALVAALGHFSDGAPAPGRRLKLALYALPALSIILLLGYYLIPRFEMRLLAQPVAVDFETKLRLRGYRFDMADQTATARLYSSANAWRWNNIGSMELGYSLHLIDQASGQSIAGVDRHFETQLEFLLFGEAYQPIYRDIAAIKLPQSMPVNRAIALALTLWRQTGDEFTPKRVLASDRPLLNDRQVILEELVLRAEPSSPPASHLAIFDGQIILDAARLPERATAGRALTITFDWRAEADASESYVQFLHLGHSESGEWQVYDQQPLGARLPTRLWYKGLADSETWRVPLPADLAAGEYKLFTGLYRLSDQERLPANDGDGAPYIDARVPLGALVMESA